MGFPQRAAQALVFSYTGTLHWNYPCEITQCISSLFLEGRGSSYSSQGEQISVLGFFNLQALGHMSLRMLPN